ncbi:hypothetical protein PR048_024770 [Dryococelus australis]|uniref:Uncharacterized protein n=1 Tax=Dryococelus australis TaxID=614101 RepID=A0ABQ9GPH0_9NEOP|nr:hypothetical protein PR048_024770 [Dryococelus australis]
MASFLHWLLHRCEVTPFLTELHVGRPAEDEKGDYGNGVALELTAAGKTSRLRGNPLALAITKRCYISNRFALSRALALGIETTTLSFLCDVMQAADAKRRQIMLNKIAVIVISESTTERSLSQLRHGLSRPLDVAEHLRQIPTRHLGFMELLPYSENTAFYNVFWNDRAQSTAKCIDMSGKFGEKSINPKWRVEIRLTVISQVRTRHRDHDQHTAIVHKTKSQSFHVNAQINPRRNFSNLHNTASRRKHCTPNAYRSDEALGVRVSVARIAPPLLDLGMRGSHGGPVVARSSLGKIACQFTALRIKTMRYSVHVPPSQLPLLHFCSSKQALISPDAGAPHDTYRDRGGVVVRLLASHLRRTWFDFPAPDFRMWQSCRTMPPVGGFSRESPVFPTPSPSFRRCSILASLHPRWLSRLGYQQRLKPTSCGAVGWFATDLGCGNSGLEFRVNSNLKYSWPPRKNGPGIHLFAATLTTVLLVEHLASQAVRVA